MFTGIVTDVGEVVSIAPRGELRRLRIACSYESRQHRAWRLDRLFGRLPDGRRRRA